MPRVDRLPSQRRFDGHAITAIAPVVAIFPAWLVAVTVFWWVLTRIAYVPFPVFSGAVLALGILLFSRPVQRVVLMRILGARPPTRAERDALQRAWYAVAQANHIPPGRFVLSVIDSDDINAFASGGHLVVVSRFAIANLSSEELTGVLAHELSHHLGMHTVALTVGQWLAVPVLVLARVGLYLQRLADAATATLASRDHWGETIARVVSGILTVVAWVFLSMITFSQYVANVVGRASEFKADQTVVEMGFGKQLRDALAKVRDEGHSGRARNWHDRLVMAHPPARTRIARIEARIRRQPTRSR